MEDLYNIEQIAKTKKCQIRRQLFIISIDFILPLLAFSFSVSTYPALSTTPVSTHTVPTLALAMSTMSDNMLPCEAVSIQQLQCPPPHPHRNREATEACRTNTTNINGSFFGRISITSQQSLFFYWEVALSIDFTHNLLRVMRTDFFLEFIM